MMMLMGILVNEINNIRHVMNHEGIITEEETETDLDK